MADIETYKSEILQCLMEHRTDHPMGFTDTELMQCCPELPLLGLRRAVDELEAEGKVHRVTADVGSARIALPDVQLEGVHMGHTGHGAAPMNIPIGGQPITKSADLPPAPASESER